MTSMQDLQTLRDKIHTQRLAGMHLLADWWFDKFTKPNHDNGDRSLSSMMAGVLADEVAEQTAIDDSDQGRQKFRDAFVARMQPTRVEIEHGRSRIPYWCGTVGCDYGPDVRLADAMKDAGIDPARAPWKTSTWIEGGGLLITIRYRGPQQVRYVAPVLDELATMPEAAISSIFPTPEDDTQVDYNYRLSLGYALSRALSTYAGIALHDEPRDTTYVLESIAKLRATVKQSNDQLHKPLTEKQAEPISVFVVVCHDHHSEDEITIHGSIESARAHVAAFQANYPKKVWKERPYGRPKWVYYADPDVDGLHVRIEASTLIVSPH